MFHMKFLLNLTEAVVGARMTTDDFNYIINEHIRQNIILSKVLDISLYSYMNRDDMLRFNKQQHVQLR